MYCTKCGCKIYEGENRCVDCGMQVTKIEYCGGFWGLVGEEEKRNSEVLLEDVKASDVKENTKIKKTCKISGVFIIALLILCMVQTICIAFLASENNVLENKYDGIKIKYQEVVSEYESLKEDIARIEKIQENDEIIGFIK